MIDLQGARAFHPASRGDTLRRQFTGLVKLSFLLSGRFRLNLRWPVCHQVDLSCSEMRGCVRVLRRRSNGFAFTAFLFLVVASAPRYR
jgi:hypothetical protein